jgi:hypothetical protein
MPRGTAPLPGELLVAFVSPLCALSVAPLIAAVLPAGASRSAWPIWLGASAFFVALWFWPSMTPYLGFGR